MIGSRKSRGRSAILIMAMFLLMLGTTSCNDDADPVAPGTANHVPNVPALDASAGAPVDDAVDVAIDATLHWTCTDPDGDALVFAVHFGQTAAPAAVATDQAGTSYTPTLANATVYFWKIVATDPDGRSTSSPVWSFTTIDPQAGESISTPNAPDGPASGEIQTSLTYNFSGAVSSLGHTVEYRADWGNGEFSTWSINQSSTHLWTATGDYSVKTQARCQQHPDIESAWSAATVLNITGPAEVAYTPSVGSDQASGGIGEDIELKAGSGGTSLYHPVEYRIDWGDGSTTDWEPPSPGIYLVATHAWSAAGHYQVRAQDRCIEHPSVVSDWSDPFDMEIYEVESITTPTMSPTGEQTLDLDSWLDLVAHSAVSNMGHVVEYQFDLGDGTMSLWQVSNSHPMALDTLGDFVFRVHARCQEHTNVVSDWSETLTVHVVDLENISRPTLSGPGTGTVGVPVTFTVSGAVSSFGHPLEYQLYLNHGAGPVGLGWTTADNLIHTWDTTDALNVQVRARCIEHPDVESPISLYHWIRIDE